MNILEIANRLIKHFQQTAGLMHTDNEDVLRDITILRDWIAAQQAIKDNNEKVTR